MNENLKETLVDATSAFASAFCVAPFIAIGDQAIVENASGRMRLIDSVASSLRLLFFRPHKFLARPAFLLLLGVYGGTYLAANTVTTVCDRKQATLPQRETSKFVFVSLINLTLNISKDRIFSRLFGQGNPRPVPFQSIAAFSLRDSMTVLTSFNLAPALGEALGGPLGRTASALFCPLAIQFVSAPVHLYGLDVYNRRTLPMRERVPFVIAEYWKTSMARCARIFPAFSILPFINRPLRRTLRENFLS